MKHGKFLLNTNHSCRYLFVLLVVLDQLIAYAVREECREKDEVWEGAGGYKGSEKKKKQ